MKARTFAGIGILVVVVILSATWPFAGAPIGLDVSSATTERADAATTTSAGGHQPDDGASSRLAVTATAIGASEAATQRVHVHVLHPDDRPTAGTEVRYWPARTEAQYERDRQAWEATGDLEAALRATGLVAIADERGIAAIDVDQNSNVCARLGDHYAELDLGWLDGPSTSPMTLVLERDVTLRILVVDTGGDAREGVPLHAEVRADSRTHGRRVDETPWRHSDRNGLVTVPHVQREVPLPGPTVVSWSMNLCYSRDETSPRQVSWSELTARDPVRFVVPAGGTVATKITDADGKPWNWSAHLDDLDSEDRRSLDNWTVPDGIGHFRQVPLGRRWQLRCHTGSPEALITTTVDFAGPVRADEVVHVALQVPERSWDVRGRLVRSDGVHLANATATCRSQIAPEPTAHECHGGLRFNRRLPASIRVIDDLTIEVRPSENSEPIVVRIDRALQSGTTDLGDIVVPVPTNDVLLAAVEVRCDGRVVTDAATLSLRTNTSRSDDNEQIFTVQRREGPVLELHGQVPGGPMRLSCYHDGCQGKAIDVEVGQRLVVELRRQAQLVLRVRPPAVPRQLLEADLLLSGDEPPTLTEDLAKTDAFAWRGVAPGIYVLRIRAQQRVIYELPTIELRPGMNVWPVDDSLLDLRDRVRAFHLDITPADGVGRVDELSTYAVPPDLPATHEDFSDYELPVATWFVPRNEPVDVLIRAPGFVPVRIANPTADTRVALQRCTKVVVIGPPDPNAKTSARLVEDAVRDPMLRTIDDDANDHDLDPSLDGDFEIGLTLAPGSVLEFTVSRGGVAGAPLRVVVGTTSPQEVRLR